MVRNLISKINIRCLFLTTSLMVVIFLTGCTDLGVFTEEENFDNYYASLGDVVGKYELEGVLKNNEYDVEKYLFNDSTLNHFTWADEDETVEYQQYVYIVIPFEKKIKIESLALFISSNDDPTYIEDLQLEFSAFYYPEATYIPDDGKIKMLTSPDTEIVEEDDGNGGTIEVEKEIEYDDLPRVAATATASCKAIDVWEDGIILKDFTQTTSYGVSYVTDKCLCVEAGSYLYIRVENNSGLNKTVMKPCNISFMNLMIRAL